MTEILQYDLAVGLAAKGVALGGSRFLKYICVLEGLAEPDSW